MDFSEEFFGLVEKYSSLQNRMSIFRQIENDILSDMQETCHKKSSFLEHEIPDTDSITEEFIKYFNYKSNNPTPISTDELYDFLTNNPDGTIKNALLFSNLISLYTKDSKIFFNHLR